MGAIVSMVCLTWFWPDHNVINGCLHRFPSSLPCSGQLAEVLNLVPWGGVSLQFRHLRLFGMQGLGGIGECCCLTAYMPAYLPACLPVFVAMACG